jgi:preprotein translocase subunit SecF
MARSQPAVARPPQRFFEIIRSGTQIDFVGVRTYALLLSGVLVFASIGMWFVRGGPNYGIDFVGGTMLHLRFSAGETASQVRGLLGEAGYGAAELQDLGGGGGEFLIRLPGGQEGDDDVAEQVVAALRQAEGTPSFEVLRTEMVGPKVGKDLRRKAILAVLASTIMMGIYLTVRFQMRFGIGAAVSLLHDVIVTVGALLLLDYEFNLPVVAALLTIIGFSVNDTVIVSDRIRENLRKMRRETLPVIVNRSINETLARTVITTGTTLFVTLALFSLGGSVIHGFAFALLVGFTAGTYSTIWIATQVVLMFGEPARR